MANLLGPLPDEELAMQGAINAEAEHQAASDAQQSADGKDMVNNASMAGISKAGREHQQAQMEAQQAQMIQGLLGPITNPMNGTQRQLAQQRMNLSSLYNQFNEAAQNAINAGDESSAQELIGYRDGVAQQAQLFDKQIQMAGISLPAAYQANVPLAVQQMAYQADSMAGLDRILNKDMSSDQFYNQEYKRLRNAGYSDRRANKMAAEAAGEYRLNRLAKLNDAFNSYGISDGGMNPAGVRMLQAMAQEDAGQANVLGNMYASPKTVQDQVIKQALERAKLEAALERTRFAQSAANQRAFNRDAVTMRGQDMTRNNIFTKEALARERNALGLGKGGSTQDKEDKQRADMLKGWIVTANNSNPLATFDERMADPEYAEKWKEYTRLVGGPKYPNLDKYAGTAGSFMSLLTDMKEGEGDFRGTKMSDDAILNSLKAYVRDGIIPPEFVDKAIEDGDLKPSQGGN